MSLDFAAGKHIAASEGFIPLWFLGGSPVLSRSKDTPIVSPSLRQRCRPSGTGSGKNRQRPVGVWPCDSVNIRVDTVAPCSPTQSPHDNSHPSKIEDFSLLPPSLPRPRVERCASTSSLMRRVSPLRVPRSVFVSTPRGSNRWECENVSLDEQIVQGGDVTENVTLHTKWQRPQIVPPLTLVRSVSPSRSHERGIPLEPSAQVVPHTPGLITGAPHDLPGSGGVAHKDTAVALGTPHAGGQRGVRRMWSRARRAKPECSTDLDAQEAEFPHRRVPMERDPSCGPRTLRTPSSHKSRSLLPVASSNWPESPSYRGFAAADKPHVIPEAEVHRASRFLRVPACSTRIIRSESVRSPSYAWSETDNTPSSSPVTPVGSFIRALDPVRSLKGSSPPMGFPMRCPGTSQPGAVKTHCALLCLGDSLTQGFVGGGATALCPYSKRLSQRLKEMNVNPVLVNAGVVGECTGQIARRLEEHLHSRKYDLVLILAGTNDLLGMQPADSIVAAIRALHNTAFNAGAHTVVMTIPELHVPNSPTARLIDDRRCQVNYELRQFACVNGHRSIFVDVAEHMPRDAAHSHLWSSDGVHMTTDGYEYLGQLLSCA